MKRAIPFLLLMYVFALTAVSQSRYTSAVLDESYFNLSNNNHCAIRYWQAGYSVAAVNLGSGMVAFCLIDHTDFDNTFFTPPPPPSPYISAQYVVFSDVLYPNLVVNDLYVANDYAFFCGGISGQAIYGYFNIPDLYNPTISIYIYPLTSTATFTAPISLQKLVAFYNGFDYDVVSYGYEKEDIYTSASIIVEVHDATNPSVAIESAEMNYNPPPYNECVFYDDIVLTNSFVVVLGHDLNTITPSSGIGYPIFSMGNRGSVVADICTSCSYYLPQSWEANDRVAGVALAGDMFAMSYVNDHGQGNYYTRLRMIEIPIMKNINSQEFKKPQKENPIEMIYLPILDAVEIMQPVHNASDFIQMYPFVTSGYITTMLTPSSDEFKSLSAIDGHRFISARNCTVYLEDRTATIPHSSSSCPTDKDLKIDIIDNLNPMCIPLGTQHINNLNQDSRIFYPDQTIFKGCYSYE